MSAIKVVMNILTKMRRFLSYHIGPREVVFDNELNNFLPNNILDFNYLIYVVGKKNVKGINYYTVLYSEAMENDV